MEGWSLVAVILVCLLVGFVIGAAFGVAAGRADVYRQLERPRWPDDHRVN